MIVVGIFVPYVDDFAMKRYHKRKTTNANVSQCIVTATRLTFFSKNSSQLLIFSSIPPTKS